MKKFTAPSLTAFVLCIALAANAKIAKVIFKKNSSPSPQHIEIRCDVMCSFKWAGVTVIQTTSAQDTGAFSRYFANNFRYPAVAKENNVSGLVIVQFDVNADKQIENIKILQSPDKSLSGEVTRVLQKFKTLSDGKPGFNYTLPILISIQHQADKDKIPKSNDDNAQLKKYKADTDRIFLKEVVFKLIIDN